MSIADDIILIAWIAVAYQLLNFIGVAAWMSFRDLRNMEWIRGIRFPMRARR